MKTLLTLVLPLVLISGLASASELKIRLKKDKQGNVYAPVVEMIGPGDIKILLVGMIHLGPSKFYTDAKETVTAWANQQGRPTVILKEFLTCSSEVFDTTNTKIAPKDLSALRDAKLDFEPLKFIEKSAADLQPLITAIKAKKSACLLDVDGKTMRPSYYVERTTRECKAAEAHSSACQWKALQFPETALIKNFEGDIKVDSFPAGMQIAAMHMFRNPGFKPKEEIRRYVRWPSFYIELDYRNYLLVSEARKHIQSGVKHIVMPWGAAHLPGLIEMLEKMDFKKSSIKDVLYTTPADIKKWKELSMPEILASDYVL